MATNCACFHSTPSASIWRQCAANDRVFSRRAPHIEDEIRQRLLTPREKLRTGRTCFARARAPLSSTSSRSNTSISVGGLDCPRPSIPSPTRKACTPLQPRRRGVRLKAHPCHGRLHNSTQHFPVRREKERAASESTYASVHRETQQADTKKQRTAFLHTITHAIQHKSRHSQPYRPVLNMRFRSMNSEETITQCKSTTPLIH